MQLRLAKDELQLVADMLAQRDSDLVNAALFGEQQRVANLLEKIIARDLRLSFDELEDLAEFLASCSVDDLGRKYGIDDIAGKQAMLSRVIDKVTEASVMV